VVDLHATTESEQGARALAGALIRGGDAGVVLCDSSPYISDMGEVITLKMQILYPFLGPTLVDIEGANNQEMDGEKHTPAKHRPK
jgi:hypothetical protein